MAYDQPLALLQPADLRTDKGNVLTSSRWRFLAQGDSWFSIGQLPPWATGNILFNIRLPDSAAAVSFASPGKTFSQMVDWHREPSFVALLAGGNLAYQWDALLMSAGGNDLFDAILTMPNEQNPQKAALRLLESPGQRPTSGNITRYIRNSGWTAFFSMILDCFVSLIAKRDDTGSKSQGVPIFVHTYDCPQPRWAPVAPGIGPWLARAFQDYAIPDEDWLPLTTYIIRQWALFLSTVNGRLQHERGVPNPGIAVINLIGTLQPAPARTSGAVGDWENEIHPTYQGYAKLGVAFEKQVPVPPASAVPQLVKPAIAA